VTSFSFLNCHNYLKLKKNWYEINLILHQKYHATRKCLGQPLNIIKVPRFGRNGQKHRRTQDIENTIRYLCQDDGSTWSESYAKMRSTSCSPCSRSSRMHIDSRRCMCVCVCVCMWVCVCVSVISMDHGTSCYEVFLPLSLTCCFLQDVSPNTANSNSPLSSSCICSPVLSQIISWCRTPELNTKGVFVVLSYWLTCINSFFLSFA